MMTREQAIDAYRRAADWERRENERLRQTILIPHFGGCMCRLHNCQVNWHYGCIEGNPVEHRERVRLAKLFDHLQAKRFETLRRLQAAFARYF